MEENEREILSWNSKEVRYDYKKEREVSIGIISITICIIAIIFKSYIFSILVLLFAGVVLYLGRRRPEEYKISITDLGIRVNEILYSYERMVHFNTLEIEGLSDLLIFDYLTEEKEDNKKMILYIKDQDRVHIENILNQNEIYHDEDFKPNIINRLVFYF